MRDWASIVQACLNGDPAAWREFVRLTFPHVDGCVRRLVARARVRIPPSPEDLCVAVYGALRRDHGRLLERLVEESSWPAWVGLEAYRAARGAIGSIEAEIPTFAASEASALAWSAYREAAIEPWDRVLVALFYFRGLRYADMAELFAAAPERVADTVRLAAGRILTRYAKAEAAKGVPPPPAASPPCPTDAVLSDFVHREVSEESRRAMTKHLDACAACRFRNDQYRRLMVSLASASPAGGGETCLTDRELLELVERRVPKEDRERVGRHLSECRSCWEGFDFLRGVTSEAPPAPLAKPDAPEAARVLALGPPALRRGTRSHLRLDRIHGRRKRWVRHLIRQRVVAGVTISVAATGLLALLAWLAAWDPLDRQDAGKRPPHGVPPSSGTNTPAQVQPPPARLNPGIGRGVEGASARAIEIDGIRGALRVRVGGLGPGVEVERKVAVSPGDELTASDEGAVFGMMGVTLGLREGTLRIVRANPDELRLDLDEGEGYVRIGPGGPGVTIRCPHGRVETSSRPGQPVALLVQVWRVRTALVVHEGKARLQGNEGRVEVTKGAWTSVRSGEGPMGITHVGSPLLPAWVEAHPPYFDILAPVTDRVAPLIIAVPHASREPGVGRVAARMGRLLEAPVLFARHFEPADVNRPQETQWGSSPVPKPTPEASQIYQLYCAFVLRAAGRRELPIPFYVELHGDELTGAGPVSAIEAVTRGFEPKDLERMRALWDRHPAHPPAPTRMPLYVDLLDPVIPAPGHEHLFAFAGYPGSFAQESGVDRARRAFIVRLPKRVRTDPELARRYGEILAEAVATLLPR
jgi:hypothetical protein